MSFATFNEKIEKHILPLANKLSSQRHLKAIRDAFISLMPITLMGGVAAVIGAAPVTEETTNGFLLAWASFAQDNATLLSWINRLVGYGKLFGDFINRDIGVLLQQNIHNFHDSFIHKRAPSLSLATIRVKRCSVKNDSGNFMWNL